MKPHPPLARTTPGRFSALLVVLGVAAACTSDTVSPPLAGPEPEPDSGDNRLGDSDAGSVIDNEDGGMRVAAPTDAGSSPTIPAGAARLFVPARPRVEVYDFAVSTGTITPIEAPHYTELDYGYDGTPYLAVHPAGTHAYAPEGGRGGTIQTLAIDSVTGALTKVSTVDKYAGGISEAGLVDPLGRAFYFGDGARLVVYEIREDGDLGEVLGTHSLGGSVRGLVADAAGSFLLASDGGAIHQLVIEADGTLRPSGMHDADGVGRLAADPGLGALFATTADGVAVFGVDPSGTVTAASEATTPVPPADVAYAPGGFVYCLTSASIVGFHVDPVTLALSPIGTITHEYLTSTQALAIDSSGRWLFEINNTPNLTPPSGIRGSVLLVFDIAADGTLTEHDAYGVYNHPVNVHFMHLPGG